jgi:hypothetical protein
MSVRGLARDIATGCGLQAVARGFSIGDVPHPPIGIRAGGYPWSDTRGKAVRETILAFERDGVITTPVRSLWVDRVVGLHPHHPFRVILLLLASEEELL